MGVGAPTDGDHLPDRAEASSGSLQNGAGNSALPNDLRDGCGAISQMTSALRLLFAPTGGARFPGLVASTGRIFPYFVLFYFCGLPILTKR